uniref:Testis-expressed sequence 36 protein-like n=1 Tax=Phallusia mammillata TaxID=59560 RepID=A0A6F9DU08_9ASCI|nr:testis-expressed sequence 36 protein-like [Phallusia mammillata]
MGKGRRFVPSQEEHGTWFTHRGMPTNIPSRESGTTTGIMLGNSLSDHSSHVKCPPLFQDKLKVPYKQQNPFSLHDNRNSFQDHGVYFGQGLGKQKTVFANGQHCSEDIVAWTEQNRRHKKNDINSLYREDFAVKERPLSCHCRRYSKFYTPSTSNLLSTPSNVTMWVGNDEIVPQTYLQTLANTQEPHLKANPWKYSYHAHTFAHSMLPKRTKVT